MFHHWISALQYHLYTPQILRIYTYLYMCEYTGRTKLVLVESSHCKPFPPRILSPREKLFSLLLFNGVTIDRATPATQNGHDKSIRHRFQVMTQTFNKRKLSSC